jgi:hypothetical protein
MSMMMRRGAAAGHGYDTGPLDATGDLRFPETAIAAAIPWPSAEIRSRVEATAGQRFTGYLGIRRLPNVGAPDGLLLFYAGQLIAARFGGADGGAALGQLLTAGGSGDIACATHALPEGAVFALASTFLAPQRSRPMATDGGEVAVLLRDLAAERHSGTVQISASNARRGSLWVRILMHEGKFLGVYSVNDRKLKPSLADVNDILTEAAPQLTLFAIQGIPAPLTLPAAPPMSVAAHPAAQVNSANAAHDEMLETDLIWFLSRFERAFGRLKDRREPQSDLLRAFGELTNELAGFVAALQQGASRGNATYEVVAAELNRARASGVITVDLKLGKAGIDAVIVAKQYGALPKRSAAAASYFTAASADLLTLMGRLMERMLGAFHDPTTAGFAREGCETLLREVRGGLGELTQR